MMWIKQIRVAVSLLVLLSVITGVLYPLLVTGIAQWFFPWRANGSLLIQDGRPVGSALLGQAFDEPKYFWGRPSATQPYPYNAESSSGSNWGPLNPDYLTAVKKRLQTLQTADRQNHDPVPVDLVTASGSGLDPDISPLAARYQVSRIAKARKLPADQLEDLITKMTQPRFMGILGEPVVNVLQLNLVLDQLDKKDHRGSA
jgi:K+-transporting ATPase ATPase C chain